MRRRDIAPAPDVGAPHRSPGPDHASRRSRRRGARYAPGAAPGTAPGTGDGIVRASRARDHAPTPGQQGTHAAAANGPTADGAAVHPGRRRTRWWAGVVLATLAIGGSVGYLTRARDERPGPSRAGFDGAHAMTYVDAQLAFGPRVPGTPAHEMAGDWLVALLRDRADTLLEQRWIHRRSDGVPVPMRNILARIHPASRERVLFIAHYDSRPISEHARKAARRLDPTPGANDGASGVALLLGVADRLRSERLLPRVLRSDTTAGAAAIGVDLLFVDGEDYGNFQRQSDVLIGSRAFARTIRDSAGAARAGIPAIVEAHYRPRLGVVWDMVADRDQQFDLEAHSMRRAYAGVRVVWRAARALGYDDVFRWKRGPGVLDDHIPLLDAGLPVIDVIDWQYAKHHTPEDDRRAVSARSLQVAGDVALRVIRDVARTSPAP